MTDHLMDIAAAVDAAVSAQTRLDWDRSAHRPPRHLLRGRVFRSCGQPYANVVGSRCELPSQLVRGGDGSARTDGAAVATELRSAFRDLVPATDDLALFVPVGREFLAGDLPIPRSPQRIVIEADGAEPCDGLVRDGLLRLKTLGCRIALGGFTGRCDQRLLLPLADFVKVDARDLDVEGRPLLDLAASRGAELVAEFVDTELTLAQCRAAGFPLVQGRALERQGRPRRPAPVGSPSGR